MGADLDEAEESEDETEEGAAIKGHRGLSSERLSSKQIIINLSDAVSAKLGVGKLLVQLEVTILLVRKEQRVLRDKLQMQQELGISTYGGGLKPTARVMLTEEEE